MRKHKRFDATTENGLTFTINGDPQMDEATRAALAAAMERAYIQIVYPEKRADGWPLCPHCGEDELWSALNWDGEGERPAMHAWICAGLTCYKCHWNSTTGAMRQ